MKNRTLVATALLLALGMAIAGPLRGAIIVAADGTFLGTCDSRYGSDSIANKYSEYGSQYGSNGMFNKYSQYGSEYATYSAFNRYTSTPPYILAADPDLLNLFTGYSYRPTPAIIQALQRSGATRVTANRSIPGGIDPNVLRVACENP